MITIINFECVLIKIRTYFTVFSKWVHLERELPVLAFSRRAEEDFIAWKGDAAHNRFFSAVWNGATHIEMRHE